MMDKSMIEALDAYFVRKDDCAEYRQIAEKEMEEVKRDYTRLETKMNMALGILSVIGAAAVTLMVKFVFFGVG